MRRRRAPNWRRAAECWTLLDTFSPGPIPNHKSLTLTPNSNADTAIAPMAARRHASAIIIGIPSPTHSFTLGLNPCFSANPPYRSPSFFSFRIPFLSFSPSGFPSLFMVSCDENVSSSWVGRCKLGITVIKFNYLVNEKKIKCPFCSRRLK